MNFRDYYLYYESTLPASNIRIVLCYCSFLLDISNQPWCLDKSAILRLSRHGLYTLHTCIRKCLYYMCDGIVYISHQYYCIFLLTQLVALTMELCSTGQKNYETSSGFTLSFFLIILKV